MRVRTLFQLIKYIIVPLLLTLACVIFWILIGRLQTQPSPTPEPIDLRPNLTPTIRPSTATLIRQIQSMHRLETVSYSVEKVITAESGQETLSFLFGDRILLVAHGQVIAGMDLSQVQEGDVMVTADDQVTMILPPAEILVATLDNEGTYVYDRETGLMGQNQDLETAARQAAEQEILNAALEDGILEMADANARIYLTQLISSLGFQGVIFVDATPTPTPPPVQITVVPATTTP